MAALPDFRLETHFAKWEFKAKYHMTASDAESISLSDLLALIALKAKDQLIARNNSIIDQNLPLWDAFFARHENLFEWLRPEGSCMAFPRYTGADGVEAFARSMVEESGVLLLPSTIYQSELGPVPDERFRIGFGRRDLDLDLGLGLAAMNDHIAGKTSNSRNSLLV